MWAQALKNKIAIRVYLCTAFVLRILASVYNDPLVTPDKKDYIYDMKETSILLCVLVAYLTVLDKFKDNVTSLIARIVLFSTVFETWREVFGGLNNLSFAGEKEMFILMHVFVVGYSLIKWEKTRRMI